MTQLSIRNVDSRIAAKLRREAGRRGQSLNRYLRSLLQESTASERAGSNAPDTDLDALAGTWSAAQARRFERLVAPFSDVDRTLWR